MTAVTIGGEGLAVRPRAVAIERERNSAGPGGGAGRTRRKFRFGKAQSLVSLLVFVAAWWAVTATHLINPLYLPSPGAVWSAFVKANTCGPISAGSTRIVCGVQQYFLWQHLLMSLERIALGLGFAIVAGVLVGFLLSSVGWLNRVVMPYINFVRALPPLGYIGLLIVWFGIGDTTKIWLLFLAAFPPIVLNGIRLAVGFAWTTVVAAELNNGIPGIGALAYLSGTEMNTPLIIACIIVIGIAALVLDGLLQLLIRTLTPWVGKE